jgi:CBS domain-containing protein
MNVKAILAAKKLGGDTITIEPTADLAAAAKLLSKHRIGAVLICGAGGRLSGILSERDIVRALSDHGADALTLPVGQVMTRDIETCSEDDAVASIMERMTAGRFRHMPVLKNEKLVGLISIGDVVKQRVDEVERESEAMRDYIRTA